MVARMTKRVLLLLPLAVVAACSGERPPPPQPAARPQPRPVVVLPPPPAPQAPPVGWADLPLTPGTWVYEGAGTYEGAGASTSSASFGAPGSPVFRITCEGPTRNVSLQRYGAAGSGVGVAAGAMAVRTSFGARSLAASPGPLFATATLAARDPLLDNMIFSRGRFSVELPGTPMVILPSWAEPARVVEDCRR